MTIPTKISTELSSLQQQVTAASPLVNATHATILALQLNAANLVSDVQAALIAPSLLDTWVAPSAPIEMIAGVLSVVSASDDERDLSLMRGIVGRVASNLDQLV